MRSPKPLAALAAAAVLGGGLAFGAAVPAYAIENPTVTVHLDQKDARRTPKTPIARSSCTV